MELSKLTFVHLQRFFGNANKTDKALIITALAEIHSAESNLNCLQALSDVAVYKEEVKKKKAPKGKNKVEVPEEPVIENPLIVDMRDLAVKCLYCISCSLYSDHSSLNKTLRTAVAAVPNILFNLGLLVCMLSEKLTALPADCSDVPSRVGIFQHLEYALMSLVFVLKYTTDESAAVALLETPLLDNIASLANETLLTHYCLQVLEAVSRCGAGADKLAESHQPLLLTLLERSARPLVEAAAAIAAPPGMFYVCNSLTQRLLVSHVTLQ